MDQNTFNIASAVGIILTFLVGILNFALTQKQLKLDNITKNRMDWINSVRSLVSEILVLTNIERTKHNYDNEEVLDAIITELDMKVSLLTMRLNFLGKIDQRILDVVNLIKSRVEAIVYYHRMFNYYSHAEENAEDLVAQYIKVHTSYDFMVLLYRYYLKKKQDINIPSEKLALSLDDLRNFNNINYCSKIGDKAYVSDFVTDDEFVSELANELDEHKKLLIKLSRIYLKSEWNRVKHESRTLSICKYNEEKEITKLEKQYSNGHYK